MDEDQWQEAREDPLLAGQLPMRLDFVQDRNCIRSRRVLLVGLSGGLMGYFLDVGSNLCQSRSYDFL